MTTGEIPDPDKTSEEYISSETANPSFSNRFDDVVRNLEARVNAGGDSALIAEELLQIIRYLRGTNIPHSPPPAQEEVVAEANGSAADVIETDRIILRGMSTDIGRHRKEVLKTPEIIKNHLGLIKSTRNEHLSHLTNGSDIKRYNNLFDRINNPDTLPRCIELADKMQEFETLEFGCSSGTVSVKTVIGADREIRDLARALVGGDVTESEAATMLAHSIFKDGYTTLTDRIDNMCLSDPVALWKTYSSDSVIGTYVDTRGTQIIDSVFDHGEHGVKWTPDKVVQLIRSANASWSRNGYGRLGLEHKQTGLLFGTIGIVEFDWMEDLFPKDRDGRRPVEFSIRMHEGFQGQKLGSEATRAVLEWGFRVKGFKTIYANAVEGNEDSLNLLGAVGMRTLFDEAVPYTSPDSGKSASFVVTSQTIQQWQQHIGTRKNPIVTVNGSPYNPELQRVN
jgi:RimJ/RimL family protein N-acetyltransferase